MAGSPLAVLDACVLVNFALCDTILRLAEPPRLFEPKWSGEIIGETIRTLEAKLGWPNSLTGHFASELRAHFADAWIKGHDALVPQMANNAKDRHVLAAAVHAEAQIIVTLNLRHFRTQHLEPWGVAAVHPQRFLAELYRQDQALVVAKLERQAFERKRSLHQLLGILRATVPEFVELISKP